MTWAFVLVLVPWGAMLLQIWKLIKVKDAKEMSIASLIIWLGYHAAWTVYNFITESVPFIFLFNSSSQLFFTILLFATVIYFRVKNG